MLCKPRPGRMGAYSGQNTLIFFYLNEFRIRSGKLGAMQGNSGKRDTIELCFHWLNLLNWISLRAWSLQIIPGSWDLPRPKSKVQFGRGKLMHSIDLSRGKIYFLHFLTSDLIGSGDAMRSIPLLIGGQFVYCSGYLTSLGVTWNWFSSFNAPQWQCLWLANLTQL